MMPTNEELLERNHNFLEEIDHNKGQYFRILHTMAKFHRYSLDAQLSFAQYAPPHASAYATADIWQRMGRSVPEGAKSVTIPAGDTQKVVYDVAETNGPGNPRNMLWRFDKKNDAVLFAGMPPINGRTEERIMGLCRMISPNNECVAQSAAIVITSRLGLNPANAVKMGQMIIENQDLEAVLTETNRISAAILDPIGKYIKSGRNDEDGKITGENLWALVSTETQVLGRDETGRIDGAPRERRTPRVSDESGNRDKGTIRQSSEPDTRGEEYLDASQTGHERNGVAGRNEPGSPAGKRAAGNGNLPVNGEVAADGLLPANEPVIQYPAPLPGDQEDCKRYFQRISNKMKDEDFLRGAIASLHIDRSRWLKVQHFGGGAYETDGLALNLIRNHIMSDLSAIEQRGITLPEEERLPLPPKYPNHFMRLGTEHYAARMQLMSPYDINNLISEIPEGYFDAYFEETKGISQEVPAAITQEELNQFRSQAHDRIAEYNTDLAHFFVDTVFDLAKNTEHPQHDDAIKMASLLVNGSRDEIKINFDKYLDSVRDTVLARSASLESEHLNEHITSIFESSKNFAPTEQGNTDQHESDRAMASNIIKMDEAGLRAFRNDLLDYLIDEGLADGADIERRKAEKQREDASRGLTMQSSVNDWLRDVRGDADIASKMHKVTFVEVLDRLRNGETEESIFGFGDSLMRQTIFRQMERMSNVSYDELVELARTNYFENAAVSGNMDSKEYVYYLDQRPAAPGTVPRNFLRIDAEDRNTRYGAIYYARELTEKEIQSNELLTAQDIKERNYEVPQLDFDHLSYESNAQGSYMRWTSMIKTSFQDYKNNTISFDEMTRRFGQVRENVAFGDPDVAEAFRNYVTTIQGFVNERESAKGEDSVLMQAYDKIEIEKEKTAKAVEKKVAAPAEVQESLETLRDQMLERARMLDSNLLNTYIGRLYQDAQQSPEQSANTRKEYLTALQPDEHYMRNFYIRYVHDTAAATIARLSGLNKQDKHDISSHINRTFDSGMFPDHVSDRRETERIVALNDEELNAYGAELLKEIQSNRSDSVAETQWGEEVPVQRTLFEGKQEEVPLSVLKIKMLDQVQQYDSAITNRHIEDLYDRALREPDYAAHVHDIFTRALSDDTAFMKSFHETHLETLRNNTLLGVRELDNAALNDHISSIFNQAMQPGQAALDARREAERLEGMDKDALLAFGREYVEQQKKTVEPPRRTSSTKRRFQANVDAIRVLKHLETIASERSVEGNPHHNEPVVASESELAVLRGYQGFGGLRNAFDRSKDDWKAEYDELKELLTDNEYASARESSINAYYTPNDVVQGMYDALDNMGFRGGFVLDPSMGSGRFFENMPQTMQNNSQLFGVELDSLTGRIAKFSYPQAEITVKGFEATSYNEDSFDVAISNVPFGNYQARDNTEKGSFLIHDFFQAKMLEQVRPGGIVAVVTTSGTMDKASASARTYFARKAELIDAIRLPNNVFGEVHTDVTSDILFFRKRERELSLEEAKTCEWVPTVTIDAENRLYENQYFMNHPEKVLGEMKTVTARYGYTLTCIPTSDKPIREQIANALGSHIGTYKEVTGERERPAQKPELSFAEAYSFHLQDGRLLFRTPQGESEPPLTKKQEERVLAILPVRDKIREMIYMQGRAETTEAQIMQSQEELNTLYDTYFEQYGAISLDKDLKKAFRDDISYPLLCSVEVIKNDEHGDYFDKKGDIFTKRIIQPHIVPDHADTAVDALSISMTEKGKVNLDFMQNLTGKSQQDLVRELEFSRIFYDHDQSSYVLAEEFLSGDVRQKLDNVNDRIEYFENELQRYAQEKVVPFSSTRYVPKNEDEERFISSPYDNMDYSSIDQVAQSVYNEQRDEFIMKNIDNKELMTAIMGHAANVHHSYYTDIAKHYKDDIHVSLEHYHEGLFPRTDTVKNGFYSHAIMEGNRRLHRIANGFTGIYAISENDGFAYNFMKDKIQEYEERGALAELSLITRGSLKDEFKQYKEKKTSEIESIKQDKTDLNVKWMTEQLDALKKNRDALITVQPKDVSAEDINVTLGATWLTPHDIEDFMEDVFESSVVGAKGGVTAFYSSEAGVWRIDNKGKDNGNTKVTLTYGYSAKMNAFHLTENALNLKTPNVYTTIQTVDGEKRVIDEQATMIAQEKQDNIKEAFSKWVFKDQARKERLVRYYNRHFNNIVPREYSGNELKFPGMNPAITLADHQKAAVAHTLFGGNTLFAHTVGAGKTFEMCASIMESKRLGLCSKAMVVVPKHLTEQFGAEFKTLYPDAHILVATKDDFTKDSRREFCSKIATYDWDAVVMGYTQFEKIPLSQERVENSITKEINELIAAQNSIQESGSSKGNRFSIRQIEEVKKRLQKRLQNLQDKPRDPTIEFENLGVDRLYVDEAHYYKNLFAYTKLSNVAGVSTTDAGKTSDMYEKCKYLNEKTNEKGIVFATGTPVSNSMVELYTMMRYLQPKRLQDAGLEAFDSWAMQYGETATGFELKPEGKGFQKKTRFANFHNLPELMAMFKEVADIKTKDVLDLKVPEAEFVVEECKCTEEQRAMVNDLAERSDRIHKGGVDPSVDNMLKITSEGKKLALDQRLINPGLPDDPNSKVNCCVKNVFNIYEKTKATKRTQLIFCDQSTPGPGFNVYQDIKDKLIKNGVAENEIAFIHDAPNEKQKAALFAKVKSGSVRVLIGSTAMMGTGTNVQDLIIASHDLDVPWRPADLEQRAGRTIRQGNKNEKVKIFRYVTKGTFDAYLWQILENKQRFISQIMTSKNPVRSAQDCDEATLSCAEVKAIAIGNPLIKEKLENDNEITRLKLARSNYLNERETLTYRIEKSLPSYIRMYEDNIGKLAADIQTVKENTKRVGEDKIFEITLNDEIYNDRKTAGEAIDDAIKGGHALDIKGTYKGLSLQIVFNPDIHDYDFTLKGASLHRTQVSSMASGHISKVEYMAKNLENELKKNQENLEKEKGNLKKAQEEYGKPFPKQDELDNRLKRAEDLDSLLLNDLDKNKDTPQSKKSAKDRNAKDDEPKKGGNGR